ncbi:MAG TPA: FecR family protein [Candidatus Acidoferrum sp.]|nr:FecR family protein [Candidatus Acidoferrum sp.]
MAKSRFLPVLLLTVIFGALLIAAPAQAGDNTSYSYARIVRLSYVTGDVQIVRADKSNKWEPAIANMPVQQGFAIGTNDGRAEIELEHGSTIWLAENSVLQFTELALSNGGRITRMTLSEGTATFNASLATGDEFEVTTPSFEVTPPNKSEFRVDMFREGGAVSVLGGKVSIHSAAGDQEVPKGQTFAVNAKSAETALKRNPARDDWDHWVNARLTAQASGQSQTALYADAPFTYGTADLANYGAWTYFPGFGYGWQPWGMSVGWAPFMAGQWMFYPSFGWTWISYEPWGWVPYHFGGWDYSPVFGWMWIPGDYGMWTAAPVNWVGVGNRIGWVPRSVHVVNAATTPVIVGSKAIGRTGTNHVMSANQVAGRLTPLSIEPAPTGKPGVPGSRPVTTARVVVPTAANLPALRAGLGTNSGAKVDVNTAHVAPPPRQVTLTNGVMPPPRIPSRPPERVTFTPGTGMPGYNGPAGQPSGISTARSPVSTMPAPTAHASGHPAGKPQ